MSVRAAQMAALIHERMLSGQMTESLETWIIKTFPKDLVTDLRRAVELIEEIDAIESVLHEVENDG